MIVGSYDVVSAGTFFESSLSIKICTKIYLKIHRALRNQKFMLRLAKLASKVLIASRNPIEVSVTYMHHLLTFWVDLMYDIHRPFTVT